MRIATLNPGLLLLQGTREAAAVARKMSAQAQQGGWRAAPGAAWAATTDEAVALGFELLVPAHDTTTRVGAAVRVMHAECWFNGRQARARLQGLSGGGGGGWGGGATRPAGLLPGRGAGGATDAASLERVREAAATFHGGARLGSSWAPVRRHLLLALFWVLIPLSWCLYPPPWPNVQWQVRLPPRHSLERTRVDPMMQVLIPPPFGCLCPSL